MIIVAPLLTSDVGPRLDGQVILCNTVFQNDLAFALGTMSLPLLTPSLISSRFLPPDPTHGGGPCRYLFRRSAIHSPVTGMAKKNQVDFQLSSPVWKKRSHNSIKLTTILVPNSQLSGNLAMFDWSNLHSNPSTIALLIENPICWVFQLQFQN